LQYRVRVAGSAVADIDSAADYIAQFAPLAAERWYRQVYEHIATLSAFPRRCPMAPEAREFGKEMRQLLYGSRNNAFRIIFSIEPHDQVNVLYVRHGRRDVARPGT
jgi:plasmid stabilization system protein ParE